MTGVSEAYVEAVNAVASRVPERPLPNGINAIDTDDWHLALNASNEPHEHEGSPIGPYCLFARHKTYFILCILDPGGGAIGGGMPESEFIEQMKAIAASAPTQPPQRAGEGG